MALPALQTHHQLDAYRKSRVLFDSMLEKFWITGQEKCSKGQPSQALDDFQSIVAVFKNEEISNLTKTQAILLANTYTTAANILMVGTVEDENLAAEYLDKALALDPTLQTALDLKQAILADHAIERELMILEEDEEMGLQQSPLTFAK